MYMKIKKGLWFSILFVGAAILSIGVFVIHPGFFLVRKKIGNGVTFPDSHISVSVEVADDPYSWSKGLMFRESLLDGNGMLFVFPNEKPRAFWMKNTLIPLDMLFISADKRVVSIQKNVAPCVTTICVSYASEHDAMYVLEVNAGFADRYGITQGDLVEI
ncbi:hypothetical protein A2532_02590 [Candidatus Wolfebacteria bacterium RIFOXYD2_FULL_48_11]|uniref:DUF192 domain-containing protein n=1 Tax=Candidatus Wolfebacteria bacterium RIFOXYD1_FULL_48_65 TaxID=1802561 RepID=A0A1F8E5U0_9BACT|nr:MAG: hypothetical protein A2610_02555 [Candidatus Wolfebacteria bacterium RIFOXYD1_FULL_48_65]OGM95925.1 MAG: hypothetical protein A2532_02590 [Candidatus Wolfebacteria bacterium RIFOXYD2_FULL_48_11]